MTMAFTEAALMNGAAARKKFKKRKINTTIDLYLNRVFIFSHIVDINKFCGAKVSENCRDKCYYFNKANLMITILFEPGP